MMNEIKTYPEMNASIVDILQVSGKPASLYAAQRIVELEGKCKVLEEALDTSQALYAYEIEAHNKTRAGAAVILEALERAKNIIICSEVFTEAVETMFDKVLTSTADQDFLDRMKAQDEEIKRLREMHVQIKDVIKASIDGYLDEELKFMKSLENYQYPDVDKTIYNLESAIEMLTGIVLAGEQSCTPTQE